MNEYPQTAVSKDYDKGLPNYTPSGMLPVFNRKSGLFRVYAKRLSMRLGSVRELGGVVGYIAVCLHILETELCEQNKKIDKLTKIVEHLAADKIPAKPKAKPKAKAKSKKA